MEYRKLGKTEIDVSVICLGSMTWGEQNTKEEAHQQLNYAFDMGVNFIDTAEMYPVPPCAETCTKTESIIGGWPKLSSQRDKIILATKVVGPGFDYIRNGQAKFDKKNITEAIEGSLNRLGVDYIDLYQLHWPDRNTNTFGQRGYTHNPEQMGTPIQEVLETLQELKKQGKVRHFGLSNETSWGAMTYLKISEQSALPRMASIQNPYSLLNRTYETNLAEVSQREGIGLLAYSPLGFGVLTGKYRQGNQPTGARLTRWRRFNRYTKPQGIKATEQYCQLAEKHDLTPTQLALAYVNTRPFVTSNIIGATNEKQLKENIESVNIKLSSEIQQEIEEIHSLIPNPCP